MYSPRITAQPMARYEECPSSYARELETAWFAEDHGIAGLKRDTAHFDNAGYDDIGDRLYPVISRVPFRSARFGIDAGGPSRSSAIEEAVRQVGAQLRPGDAYWLTEAISRRDAVVEHVMERCVKDGASIGGIEVVTGQQRLHVEMPISGDRTEWIAGKPGWLLVVKDREQRALRAAIVDFKMDFREMGLAQNNPELRTLAVLTAVNWPDLRDVTVAQVGRGDLKPGQVFSHTFPIEDLGGAHFDRLVTTLRDAIDHAEPLFNSGGSPSSEHSSHLDAAAKPGGHCSLCTGKCGCGALQAYLAKGATQSEAQAEQMKAWRKTFTAATAALEQGAEAEKPLTKEEIQVTIDKLVSASAAITATAPQIALMAAFKKDSDELVRQLIEAGHSVPGHSVKAGNPTMNVREISGEALDPAAVYDRLTKHGLLPNVSQEDFVRVTAELSPTRLRGLLADLHKIPESEVFSLKLKPLGEDSPIVVGQKAGTVVRTPVVVAQEKPKATAPAPAPEKKEAPKAAGRKR